MTAIDWSFREDLNEGRIELGTGRVKEGALTMGQSVSAALMAVMSLFSSLDLQT